MANTAQSRKRARQSEKRREHNAALRTAFRSAVKKAQKAIAAGDKAGAARLFSVATSALDRIADKKVIHKNTAARHKRRLAAEIKALA
jgi:small subunit ribosomal protein S20